MKPEDWKQWRDWARVLVFWKHELHKHGLSINAIAEIVQREPTILLREMRAEPVGIGGSHCKILDSPVFCVRFMEFMLQGPKQHVLKFKKKRFTCPDTSTNVLKEAKEVLSKYPWPKYTGLLKCKGTTEPPPDLEKLRAVARGEVCPWGKAWERRWADAKRPARKRKKTAS